MTSIEDVPNVDGSTPPEGMIRAAMAGPRKGWRYHMIKMPDEMWQELERVALDEGREQGRPKSVNSVVLKMLLRGIETTPAPALEVEP